jgi:DNA-binding PadR family transcriptional regulator
MSDNKEPRGIYNITNEEVEVLKELAQQEIKNKKTCSIENLIEYAKETKKIANELYPKDRVEVYVDEDKKSVIIDFPDSDAFWNKVKTSEVILKRLIAKKDTTVNRRIYV